MVACWSPRLLLLVMLLTQVGLAATKSDGEFAGLQITGLQKFPESEAHAAVKDQWAEIKRRGLSASRANDAAFLLNLALRQNGFSNARVDWERSGSSGLNLIVLEGPQLMLGEVTVTGARALDAALLKEALIGDLKGRQSLLSTDSNLPFVRRELESGTQAIEAYAIYEGHRSATATLVQTVASTETNKVDVLVNLIEGPKSTIRSITIQGIDGRLYAKLKRLAEDYHGNPWNVANTRKVQGLLLRELNDRGYYDATVAVQDGLPSAELTATEIDMIVNVESGPMYQIAGIVVSGNQALSNDFIETRFSRLLGESYDPGAVRKVFRELAQTGLFENVEITPDPLGNGTLNLNVAVEEAKHKDVGIYGGLGSFDGYIIGLTHSNRNLLGTGRSLRSQLEANGRGFLGEVNYLNRWLFDSRWQFGVQVFSSTRYLLGYDKWEIGARSTLSYPFTEHTKLSLFAEWSHVSLTDNRFVEVDIGPEDYQVQTFGLALTWDHSKDLETQGHGYLLETSFDYATPLFGDDVHFARGNFRMSHYWSLFWETELRLGVRVGAMVPLGNADRVPIDLRYFSGGSRSVRSFPERELGPEDRRHHPLGGEFYSVANIEYAVPIADGFQFALFGDAGNVMTDVGDAGFDDMHYAAGVGLRYDLPVGPLRLDYGFNLNRDQGEPKGSFHIAFGFAF